jgi:hypothetical protein
MTQPARIALVAGLALLAVAVGLTLSRSPMSIARTNGTPLREYRVAETAQGATYCQPHELLPSGTSAIRLSLSAFTGPRVRVVVSSGGSTVTSGTRGSGWTSMVVAVPVKPLPRAVSNATVCASFRTHHETVTVFGMRAPSALATRQGRRTLQGTMTIEYLRPGTRSWASMAPSIARRLGLGRASTGTWIVLLPLALLAVIAAAASKLLLKELS